MSEVAPEAPAEDAPDVAADAEAPAEDAAEVTEEAPEEPKPTVEDAARVLLAFVDEGRKPGDRDLDAARDILRDILG